MSKLVIQDERGFNQLFAPVGSTVLRSKRRAEWFVEQASSAKRILEVGCGTGETAAFVAKKTGVEVVAVDVSLAFLELARQRHSLPNLTFQYCDLFEGDIADLGKFDLVIGNGILHHLIPQLIQVLERLKQMAPDGSLAFIEPNYLNPICFVLFGTSFGRRIGRLEPDEMAFTPKKLRRFLEDAGWCDVNPQLKDFLLPGLPEAFISPSLTVEPIMERYALTRWMAQSIFVTARAKYA